MQGLHATGPHRNTSDGQATTDAVPITELRTDFTRVRSWVVVDLYDKSFLQPLTSDGDGEPVRKFTEKLSDAKLFDTLTEAKIAYDLAVSQPNTASSDIAVVEIHADLPEHW